jgi:hypothetical protein
MPSRSLRKGGCGEKYVSSAPRRAVNYLLFSIFRELALNTNPRHRKHLQRRRVDGEHYREIAGKLREAARQCRFVVARRELLKLAASFERRAEHFDRRSRPACSST